MICVPKPRERVDRLSRRTAVALGLALQACLTTAACDPGPPLAAAADPPQATPTAVTPTTATPTAATQQPSEPRVITLAFAGDVHFQAHLAAMLDVDNAAPARVDHPRSRARLKRIGRPSRIDLNSADQCTRPPELKADSSSKW